MSAVRSNSRVTWAELHAEVSRMAQALRAQGVKPGDRVGTSLKLIGRHKPDFTITLPDGRIEVHEVKGGQATKTEAWGLRKKLFEANYPHIRYRVFEFGSERRARVIRWDV